MKSGSRNVDMTDVLAFARGMVITLREQSVRRIQAAQMESHHAQFDAYLPHR